MRIFILGNGEWEDPKALFSSIRKHDLVVACNGAYNKARKFGVTPQVILGDLDSLKFNQSIDSGTRVLRFSREKDQTDGELALQFALKQKPQEIVWYAALGNRWDQTVANLFLLIQAARKKVRVRLVQGRWTVYLIYRSLAIAGKKGDCVSLLPFSRKVEGISTRGLKYSLRNEILLQHASKGVSNELIASSASIIIRKGWLLVLHERSKG